MARRVLVGSTMKRTMPALLLTASTCLIAATLATSVAAQSAAPVSTPPPAVPTAPVAPVAPAVPVATTTTTSADTANDTTAGPSTPQPRPADTITVRRSMTPNRPWLIGGAALLVGTYVPTAVIASTEGRNIEDSNLLIPVVGPWLNLADRRCDACSGETGNVALVIGSGVLQAAGVGMVIMSFLIPEKIEAATIQAGPFKLNVTPTQVGRSGMGLGAVGVF